MSATFHVLSWLTTSVLEYDTFWLFGMHRYAESDIVASRDGFGVVHRDYYRAAVKS